jgi:hypothetical protein
MHADRPCGDCVENYSFIRVRQSNVINAKYYDR